MGLPEYGGKGSWSDRRFGTPVVYLQSEKAIITVPKQPARQIDDLDPNQKVPCPNPKDLNSFIFLDSTVCVECQHEVMLCPGCRDNGLQRLMDKTIGRCGKCGYRLSERQPTPAAGVAGAGAALNAAKEEAPSPAAPVPPQRVADTASSQASWGNSASDFAQSTA